MEPNNLIFKKKLPTRLTKAFILGDLLSGSSDACAQYQCAMCCRCKESKPMLEIATNSKLMRRLFVFFFG
jgi:hypothetical protein